MAKVRASKDWRAEVGQNWETLKRDWCYMGVRSTRRGETYKVGDTARRSHDWDFDTDTSSDELLDGTCAVNVLFHDADSAEEMIQCIEAAANQARAYDGYNLVLLGTVTGIDYGNDPSEVVMKWAEVLVILE